MSESNGLPDSRGPTQPTVVRSAVVAVRLLLLLLAAGVAMTAALFGRRDLTGDGARYACPMHSQVRTAEPGECPICGMKLQAVSQDVAAIASTYADLAAVENVRRHNIIGFVRKRSLLFNERELRGPAWVETDGTIAAIFYRDEVDALAVDERGSFLLTQAPTRAFPVRRTSDSAVPWDGSTLRIRFRADAVRAASAGDLPRPGQVGWLELAPRPRQVLTVPASAILQSPEGPYVLVSVGGFRFAKRPIEIGETFLKEGFAVVLSGLRVNDRVVARATFFLDADRRLGTQAGEAGWAPP